MMGVSVDIDPSIDLIANVDVRRREDFGELLGHILVLDGVLQVPEHLLGEPA